MLTPSRFLLLAGALAACAGHDDAHPELGSLAASGSHLLPAGYLSTRGSQIVDEHGTPVRLACAGYVAPVDIEADLNGMVAAGFNCLRYPWFNGTMASDLANVDAIVATASRLGLKVILDHHGDEVPGPSNGWLPFPCNGLPFDQGDGTNGTDGCGDQGTVSRDRFVQDWVTFAGRYANNPTVIGVDLTNEPHLAPSFWADNPGGATWADGAATDIRQIYSDAGKQIQAVNPGLLIICEGPFAFTGTLYDGQQTVIGGEADLSLAASNPVTVDVPNKVVYSVHHYPSSIGGAGIDSGPTAIQSMNQSWGYLVSQRIAPVWVGELGASLDGAGPDSAGDKLADEQAWAATLVDYLNGKDGDQGGPTFSGDEQGVGTDWWAWGYQPGQEPDGTIGDDGQLRPQQYEVYSQLQYTASAGCEVSADHATVTSAGPTLCDAAGNQWAIAGDGTMTENGQNVLYSANVIELAYVDGVIWQENASQLWWSFVDGGWAPASGTPNAPL
ncbi:MAG TPA: cellulase family glycosylhydrolase [Kofleriaceae bacterium]